MRTSAASAHCIALNGAAAYGARPEHWTRNMVPRCSRGAYDNAPEGTRSLRDAATDSAEIDARPIVEQAGARVDPQLLVAEISFIFSKTG